MTYEESNQISAVSTNDDNVMGDESSLHHDDITSSGSLDVSCSAENESELDGHHKEEASNNDTAGSSRPMSDGSISDVSSTVSYSVDSDNTITPATSRPSSRHSPELNSD
jgi:hypothetical protein